MVKGGRPAAFLCAAKPRIPRWPRSGLVLRARRSRASPTIPPKAASLRGRAAAESFAERSEVQSAFVPAFTLAPDLASIVQPGLLWWEGAQVVDREPRMD